MRTTRLPAVHAMISVSVRVWGVGPQVNKFEQVFSDGQGLGPMFDVYSRAGPGLVVEAV